MLVGENKEILHSIGAERLDPIVHSYILVLDLLQDHREHDDIIYRWILEQINLKHRKIVKKNKASSEKIHRLNRKAPDGAPRWCRRLGLWRRLSSAEQRRNRRPCRSRRRSRCRPWGNALLRPLRSLVWELRQRAFFPEEVRGWDTHLDDSSLLRLLHKRFALQHGSRCQAPGI